MTRVAFVAANAIDHEEIQSPLILFLLFINDMPDYIMSSITLFADDIQAYKDVQTEKEMLTLQKDVDSLCEWSLKWQLKVNATK